MTLNGSNNPHQNEPLQPDPTNAFGSHCTADQVKKRYPRDADDKRWKRMKFDKNARLEMRK
jgi:hypothetical protein